MEKGFYRDSQDNLCYRGKYEYSLLNGVTDKGFSSDILFIFREATHEDIEKGFTGEVVGFVYGGFDDLDFVERVIKEYEEKDV